MDTHSFEFLSVVYHNDGTSTWTYRVTSGRKPSLSHWVLEWDSSLGAGNVIDASEVYDVGDDGKTGVYGFKFDEGCDDEEVREAWFTLDAWYTATETRIATKAGKNVAVDGTIPGPSPEILAEENQFPIASDDAARTEENEPAIIDVLANDSDQDGQLAPGTLTITRDPDHGTATVQSGAIRYSPDPGFCGDDDFAYTVEDDEGAVSNEAFVDVDVECNEPPEAEDDDATTNENTSVGIDILSNDADEDGTLDPGTVALSRNPSQGSVSVHPTTGVVTYTPDPGSCGEDAFAYTVQDDDGAASNEATVRIEILCDDPPLAVDDLYNVVEGESLTTGAPGVLANDVTSPAQPLSAVLVSDVEHGTLRLNGDGSFDYEHDGSETTSDSFRYEATDGTDVSNVATVRLIVHPSNDAPIPADDEASTREDEPVEIDVLRNDTDPDGDGLTIDWIDRPEHGTTSNHGSALTYTPAPDFHGTDTFTYGVSDGNGGTASATVIVSVSPVNDPPVAQNDSASTEEDEPVLIHVLDNDSDPDGDALSVESARQPGHGDVETDGRTVTYTPDPDFHGEDTFTYTVSDGHGERAEATVTVTVHPVNDRPAAQADQATTSEEIAVSISVLQNDTDPDGDSLTIVAVDRPSNGSAEIRGDALLYTPEEDFAGRDAFVYTLSDGRGGTDTAEVTITVEPINDPPTAAEDRATTSEDEPVSIAVLNNDTDPEDDALTILSVSQPGSGTVTHDGEQVQYTPDPDTHGDDEFTYTISDGDATASATVRITVIPVNDPPVAVDDSAEGSEDEPVFIEVLSNDEDPDGDALSLQSLSRPSQGSARIDGGGVLYTPDADVHGTDTFTYTVSDGNGGLSTATVTVSVAPVNDPPVAQNDSATTDEETLVEIPVLENDHDPDGDFLTIESFTAPGHGSVMNSGTSLSYVPEDGFQGIDGFSYTVSDHNGGTATAQVTISVAGVNDSPTAQDDSAVTDEGTPVAIDALANDSDPDGDPLSIESVTQAAHGTVTNNHNNITYEPEPGFHGIDTFTYAASDGNGGVASAQVTVAVAAVNDPPVAQDDEASTAEETTVAILVLDNDHDPDDDPLTIESLTSSDHGFADNQGDRILYTPDTDYHGTDILSYTVSDGKGSTDTAEVRIVITPVNDAPIAQDDSDTTPEETPILLEVLANDSDPDGDRLTIVSVDRPAHGDIAFTGESMTYTPDQDFTGTDTFSYEIADGQGGRDIATVSVSVTPVNDTPRAVDDEDSTQEDAPLTLRVLDNDSDSDGDRLEIAALTQPAHGTATLQGDEIVYQPSPGYEGEDAFSYTVSDGNGGADEAEVRITVIGTNDAPIAEDDETATLEDRPVTISVLSNDRDPDADPLSIESISRPLHGTATPSGMSIVYTPAPGFAGEDTFTYTLTDSHGGTDTGTVTITVTATNDAPVAQDDSHATSEDQPVTIAVLANDRDPDADPLTVESIVQPEHGTVVNRGDALTYTPDPGFSGADAFSYTVSDGQGKTDSATVVVTVNQVNDPPLAQDDSAATLEGTMITLPILENDSDPDGDFLIVESFSQPRHGTVLNSRTGISYIPDPDFQGTDTFTYTVSDGNGGSATATVTVSVAEVNDAPSAEDDSAVTDEGIDIVIPVLLNDSDPDGDELRIESISQPSTGTATHDGTFITYTPDPGEHGVDTFTYTVSDGRGETSTASIFVAVAPVNDPPEAQDDSAETEQDVPVTVLVLGNDSDPEGDRLVIESVSAPANGRIENLGDRLIYTPNASFNGTDRFTYTVSDGRDGTAMATVTVGVIGGAGGGGAEEAASCEGRVIIHEIAWAGSASNGQDEWIELRNLGTTPVDLTGWVLRWRRTHPSTPEDQVWKAVELSGTIPGARTAACDELDGSDDPAVRFLQEEPDDLAWLVLSSSSDLDPGYYTLERRRDEAILDIDADLLYDTTSSPHLDLSDLGDVIMLLDPTGEVVDTANAPNLGRNGWVAGSSATFGTMERIDPLGPDTADNWHTNLGIDIDGDDARGRPLRGTPGRANSPVLEDLGNHTEIRPTTVRSGEVLAVDFPLSRADRRTTGWPWITVIRPGFAGSAGSGGSTDFVNYSFSGGHEDATSYVLRIGTESLPPGEYAFWIVFGDGEAKLVPIVVTP